MSQNDDKSDEVPSSFLTSLGDDELIEFINKLSQKSAKNEAPKEDENGYEQNEEETSKTFDDSLDFQLAQLPSSPLADKDVLISEHEAEDQDKEPDFGDYKSYFNDKQKAQQEVDLQVEKKSEILKGCKIYVNGYTNPSRRQLHKLIVENGGQFVHFLSNKSSATHIVATRLTPRKLQEFRNYKVVQPEWVVKSIEVGEIQDWRDYSLIKNDYGQTMLNLKQVEEVESEEVRKDDSKEESKDEEEEIVVTQEDEDKTPVEALDLAINSKHPDFLKVFFSKSRLHHLSTWKNDLKSEFLSVAKKKLETHTISKSVKRTILHIDFDCFFAKVSSLNHPEVDFDNQPVCVTHGTLDTSASDIASCNYKCREFGVRNGMWLHRAKQKCPDLICLEYDFKNYERISKLFYNVLVELNFDSLLPVSIDEALLDITTIAEEEFDLGEFISDLRQKVFDLTKCTVSCGISENVLLAKMALKKAKPNGVYFLKKDENVCEFLSHFSVKDLPGVGYSAIQKLSNELHVEEVKVGDLQKLSNDFLIRLFGIKTGCKLFNFGKGNDDTSIDILKNDFSQKSVSLDINWGVRFDTMIQVDSFLFQLGEELSKKLKKLNSFTTSLTLKLMIRKSGAPVEPAKYLGCGECNSITKSSKLGIETNDFKIFGTEFKNLIRSLEFKVEDIRGISVQANKLVDKVSNQQRLPFKKVEINRGKKKQEITESPKTQYQIPSDEISSSVVKELPSSIVKQIEQKKKQSEESVYELPKQVDPQVFNELPPEIQLELKQELSRRNINIGGKSSPERNSTYYQQIFTSQGHKVIKVRSPKKAALNSPTKKHANRNVFKSPSKPPPVIPKFEKYDENVLNELPPSIRNDIIKEWKEYENANKLQKDILKDKIVKQKDLKEAKIKRKKMKVVKFQNLSKASEIFELVKKWIKASNNKLNTKDIDVFKQYFDELITNGNLILSINLFKHIKIIVELTYGNSTDTDNNDWGKLLTELKKKMATICNEKNWVIPDL